MNVSADKPAPRLATILLGLTAALPAIVPIGFVATTGIEHHRRGSEFVPGLHVFGFMAALMVSFSSFLAAAAVASLVVSALRNRRTSATLPILCGSVIVGVLVSVISPFVCAAAFSAGRERAYGRVDAASLATACRPLAAEVACGRSNTIRPEQPEYAVLPEAVRSLRPLTVIVGPRGVALHMDGGGIAGYEGLVIYRNPADGAAAGLTALDSEVGVFRFAGDGLFEMVRDPPH